MAASMNIKPDVEQDPLLAADGLRNGDKPPCYYSHHGRIVMSISIVAAIIVVGIRISNSQHAKLTDPEFPLIEESESKTCSPGYDLKDGDIQGWGKVNGKGGGEEVDSCDDCAQLCNSDADCLSFECSHTALKCNLNSAAATNRGSYKDFFFCSKVEEPTDAPTEAPTTTEAPPKAMDSFEEFAQHSCHGEGYVSLSRKDNLEACASTCQASAECKFVSFCPKEAETCEGRNAGKCVLYSRCENLNTKSTDYITYKLNQA